MENKNVQIGLINVVVGVALVWYLIAQRAIYTPEVLFFWLATGTFLIHWYWGLIAYVNYVGPTDNLGEFFLDIIAVGAQVSTIFWINLPVVWFLLNALSFSLAIVKYLISLKTRQLSSRLADYIKEKMRIHSLGIVGMLAGAATVGYLRPVWPLGLVTLLVHLAVIYYLVVKKVYSFNA